MKKLIGTNPLTLPNDHVPHPELGSHSKSRKAMSFKLVLGVILGSKGTEERQMLPVYSKRRLPSRRELYLAQL